MKKLLITRSLDKEIVSPLEDIYEVDMYESADSTMPVGFDHVDTLLLKERGICLGYTPDILTDSVADTTIALMLAAARRIPESIAAAKDGEWGTWAPYWLTGQDLSRSTVGIIGF